MFLKLYGIALPIFLMMDGIWLGVVAKNFYSKYLGYLMSPTPNWAAAGVFYGLYIFGIVALILQPAMNGSSVGEVLWRGALFGLVGYATYDLTNLATIRDWPMIVTVVDLIWGTFLTGTIASLTFIIAKKLGL